MIKKLTRGCLALICVFSASAFSQEPLGDRIKVEFMLPNGSEYKPRRSPEEMHVQEWLIRGYFLKSAAKHLPDGHRLNIKVLGVHYGGRYHYDARLDDFEKINDGLHPPRIKLAYQWMDEEENMILSSEQELEANSHITKSWLNKKVRFRGQTVQELIDRWVESLSEFWEENQEKA